MNIEQLELVTSLFQQLCVYLVIAWLLSKTPLFMPLTQVTLTLRHKLVCYLIFSTFCVMGTYFGLRINNSIANTRAIGAVLGGIVGGPVVGLLVGLTGGLHRYSLGGFTALACTFSTVAEGVLGGLVHRHFVSRHRFELLFNPWVVGSVALVAELMQMGIIILVARPHEEALALVHTIMLPMLIANTVGAAMFMRMILDRRAMLEKYSVAFSAKALKIAERTLGVLDKGFTPQHCNQMARILFEETGVGAVAITDRERLLAFIGIGEDHHLPGTRITSPHTLRAIDHNEVVYADGNLIPYNCTLHPNCKLGSSLVIPLRGEEDQVVGTIKLYEPKRKLFSSMNRTLGEGIARLLSGQILSGKYNEQKRLLAQSEIKLLQAQINPHFLFNALNTLSAVIRRDPQEARNLVQHLSTFFRKNLKRQEDEVSLREEMEHVEAYLQIERARFRDRLTVNLAIPDELQELRLPAFSLQPVVENAIKHGLSQILGQGELSLTAQRRGQLLQLEVCDNAGLYRPSGSTCGLGMNIVDRRIKARYGSQYGLQVSCIADEETRVTIILPAEESAC
ncbi:two-component system, LytT family, sensor kinase [Aeromonas sp. RU39B]|uniref:sensor histidine kinase n=1 Tax=Aeromonas sp. RU39B TaxID=1907416 RepID=UPI000954BA8D|nr:two-component system, LytT family, sensor kinase [Aeromonas sp. RU39B]